MPTTPHTESSMHDGLLAKLPVSEGATTSRVVVNNKILRQVLFSFDAGQVLTEHAAPRAVIVQMISGALDFTVGGETRRLVGGDVAYLAPGDRHAVEAVEPTYMALTLVDLDATKVGAD